MALSPLKNVLVVDDNEILLRAWERILAKEGCVCFATTKPEEAIAYLENSPVDLLISDIVMPRIDGFDLLQKLTQMGMTVRVLLTTGYVCDFTRLKLDMGSQHIHVLMKPYNDIQEIGGFVHRMLQNDPSLNQERSCTSLDDARVHLWSL